MLEHIGSISALLKASLKWPIPSAITIMKEPYIILDVNPAWEEASGWKREEVVGRSLDDLHLWVHPEDRPIMLRHLQEEGPQLAFVEFRMKDGSVKSFVGTLVETSAGDVKGTAIEDGRLKAA
jgi:PAS domain S-box-containing protein